LRHEEHKMCTGPRLVQTELAFCLLFYVITYLFFFFPFPFAKKKKVEGDRSGEVTQIKGLHKQKELQGLLST